MMTDIHEDLVEMRARKDILEKLFMQNGEVFECCGSCRYWDSEDGNIGSCRSSTCGRWLKNKSCINLKRDTKTITVNEITKKHWKHGECRECEFYRGAPGETAFENASCEAWNFNRNAKDWCELFGLIKKQKKRKKTIQDEKRVRRTF